MRWNNTLSSFKPHPDSTYKENDTYIRLRQCDLKAIPRCVS